MYIQSLCAFLRVKMVPGGQYMGYKLTDHVFRSILRNALTVPGGSLGARLACLADTWGSLGVCEVPWVLVKVLGSMAVPSEGSWEISRGSLGVLGTASGGSEASLGVVVSATDRFVMYTTEFIHVPGVSPTATTPIGGHPSVTRVAEFGRY